MLTPDDPQPTPDWHVQYRRCTCYCLCARNDARWNTAPRTRCGCCPSNCRVCEHGLEVHTHADEAMPLTWDGDQA